jgi:hypothetical protein
MPSELPSERDITGYFKRRLTLQPEKFGSVGAYSREALEASVSYDFMYDQQLLRLTTTILSGRTVSEHPEVELKYPADWWQHLKYNLIGWWYARADELRLNKMFFLRAWLLTLACFVIRKTFRKPVKYSKLTAKIAFEQHFLYPEFDDIPAELGRPVIYESLDFESVWEPATELWGTSLQQASRFLNRHEIISEIYRAPLDSYVGSRSAETVLTWLEQRGVNVDQLVKRRYP